MTSLKTTRIGACLASILILFCSAGWASEEGEASSGKGLATLAFEGASEKAIYSIDGQMLTLPPDLNGSSKVVVKAGRHVIEVHEGEDVVLREEIVLTAGETRTLRVTKAEPE
jgi:hypothetical protein